MAFDPAEQDRHFELYFGVSRAQLVAQGVDLEKYVHENASKGTDRVYRLAEEKLRAGESLLPYWVPTPYVSRGFTKFAAQVDASLTVTATTICLDDMVDFHVESLRSQVCVTRIPLWLGIGARLDFGSQGRWNVQARYSPTSWRRGRRADVVFKAALREAGAIFD